MNYVTVQELQTYVDSFILDTDDYDIASVPKRTKALTLATRAIDRLNFQGDKYDSGQVNQFPRGTDVTVPTDIKSATCELALAYLAGKNLDEQFDNLEIAHEAFMGVKTAKDPKFKPEHMVNGILSLTAWQLLRPYLEPVQLEILKS